MSFEGQSGQYASLACQKWQEILSCLYGLSVNGSNDISCLDVGMGIQRTAWQYLVEANARTFIRLIVEGSQFGRRESISVGIEPASRM